jgi:hypothetical protein
MFAHESWMNIFFKLLNFVALFGLLAFIFRRYLLGGIQQEILQEKQQEEGMATRIVTLEQKGKELAQDAIRQEHDTRFLLDRAQQWQATFVLEQEKRRHEQQVMYDAARAKKQQQLRAMASDKLMETVVPQAIEKARGKLVEQFLDEERGREYLQVLLASMKKSL